MPHVATKVCETLESYDRTSGLMLREGAMYDVGDT